MGSTKSSSNDNDVEDSNINSGNIQATANQLDINEQISLLSENSNSENAGRPLLRGIPPLPLLVTSNRTQSTSTLPITNVRRQITQNEENNSQKSNSQLSSASS